MRVGRLSQSFALRLTILYLGLFTASALLLLGATWWFSVRAPMQAVKVVVVEEAERLSDVHRREGVAGLTAALDRRTRAENGAMPFHALVAADGRTLTATLPSWPREHVDGWGRLEADLFVNGEEYDHEALVLDRRLPDGTRLIVGRDIEELADREEWIEEVSFYALGIIVLLGLVGGLLMSRAIGNKLESVSRTARQVMAGNLSGRVETSGSGDDFDELGNTLNAMLTRIEQLVESIGRVSDSIAHELRTPLARLKVSLEELSADDPRAEAALAEADRLQAIFDALLRIARVERGGQALKRTPIDIGAILQDAADSYDPEAEAAGQQLVVDCEAGLRVYGDRDLLFQAIANLLDNSVKYSPAGARVLLRGRRIGEAILIEVCDTGPGIAAEHVGRLTERFYRAPESLAKPGAGLGLSLVAAVARAHHAALTFDSRSSGLCARLIFGPTDDAEGIEGIADSSATTRE